MVQGLQGLESKELNNYATTIIWFTSVVFLNICSAPEFDLFG